MSTGISEATYQREEAALQKARSFAMNWDYGILFAIGAFFGVVALMTVIFGGITGGAMVGVLVLGAVIDRFTGAGETIMVFGFAGFCAILGVISLYIAIAGQLGH